MNSPPSITAPASAQATRFTDIESFAFAEGDLIFDADSLAMTTARLYLVALGRAPDPLGLADNVTLLSTTVPYSQMAEYLAPSLEFRLRYPAADTDRRDAAPLCSRVPDTRGMNRPAAIVRAAEYPSCRVASTN